MSRLEEIQAGLPGPNVRRPLPGVLGEMEQLLTLVDQLYGALNEETLLHACCMGHGPECSVRERSIKALALCEEETPDA